VSGACAARYLRPVARLAATIGQVIANAEVASHPQICIATMSITIKPPTAPNG
jgi:hypothetical protein